MLQPLAQKSCRKPQPMSISPPKQSHKPDRLNFIGGSDARVIMGKDDKALLRLWQGKRGEVATLDLSGGLIVQPRLVTQELHRRSYQHHSRHRISAIQRQAVHPTTPCL